MQKVENGLFISVMYTGTLDDGEVFDSNIGKSPLEIKMGAGQLIEGFESALKGMMINEKKSISIEPSRAYGNYLENMIFDIPRSQLPTEMVPEIGMTVMLTTPEGQEIPARMTKMDAESITMDLNHPLAGKTLNFDIEIVGINDSPTQGGCGCSCSSDCSC